MGHGRTINRDSGKSCFIISSYNYIGVRAINGTAVANLKGESSKTTTGGDHTTPCPMKFFRGLQLMIFREAGNLNLINGVVKKRRMP